MTGRERLEGEQLVHAEQIFKPFEVGEISWHYFGKPLDSWSVTAGVPLELRGRRVAAEFRAIPYFLRRKNTVCLSNPELGYRITEEDLATYNRFAKTPLSQSGDEGEARLQSSAALNCEADVNLLKKTAAFQAAEVYKTRAAKLGMSRWDEFIVPDRASLLLMAIIRVSGPELATLGGLRLHLYSPGGRFQSSAYEIMPDRTLNFYYFHPLDTKPLASSGDDLVPNGVRLSIPIVNNTESLENLIKRLADIAARFAFQ